MKSDKKLTLILSRSKKITPLQIKKFQEHIQNYFRDFGRSFVWRETTIPYHIVVSEIMLQQTQVKRVEKKYPEFIARFPNFSSLASAKLSEIYSVWSGMGYNRRALALKKISEILFKEHNGVLPNDATLLEKFPGIGKATAASICAFAFNAPTVFIETNIRTVFLHFFFSNKTNIPDQKLIPLVESTLDQKNPRLWYFALMDYGAFLKSSFPNPSRASLSHRPQSKFRGSMREVRGTILKMLSKKPMTRASLKKESGFPKEMIAKSVIDLVRDGLVTCFGQILRIP